MPSSDEALTPEEIQGRSENKSKRNKKNKKSKRPVDQTLDDGACSAQEDLQQNVLQGALPPTCDDPPSDGRPSPTPRPALPSVLTPPDTCPSALTSPDLAPHRATTAAVSVPFRQTAHSDGLASLAPSPTDGNILQLPSSLCPTSGGLSPANRPATLHGLASSPQRSYLAMQSLQRRPSSASQSPRMLRVHDPPPPHMPQRHFARLPDPTYGLTQEDVMAPGSSGYFCGFDTLEESNCGALSPANAVLLLGSEGALDVYRISRTRRDIIARLEGLRGGVIGAKILPWTGRSDPFHTIRPLVACVIHGPAFKKQLDRNFDSPEQELVNGHAPITNYQTSVEIFSLSTQRHVATLFESPISSIDYPVTHHLFVAPSPIGCLRLSAEGRFVAVASGKSGEIYVFTPQMSNTGSQTSFDCIGKFWTNIKSHRSNAARSATGKDDPPPKPDTFSSVAIYSLSGRWLAISPPLLSSSHVSMDGNVPLSPERPKPVGVSDYVSPPPPPPNCDIDAPPGSSILNRVTKQATQELRKGAQWVGEQSMNIWKSYWSQQHADENITSFPPQQSPSDDSHGGFPPTHGHKAEILPSTVEPSLVSIIDLQKLVCNDDLKTKNPLVPLATMFLNDGCSFLSYAPNGLILLSTNRAGDVSTIWDLMRITDARVAHSLSLRNGGALPHATGVVRQAARFPRMSASSVVDVQWAAQSNRLAILTERGTIHLHELPRGDTRESILQSPVPTPQSQPESPSPGTSPQALPASGWMSNVRAGWQNVQGRLNTVRSRSGSDGYGLPTLSTLGNASVAARYAGKRVVRNGFNIAAEGAHHLRHAEENKIRLRHKLYAPGLGCSRWLSGKEAGLIAVVADGVLSIYSVRSIFHEQGKRRTILLDASKKATADHTLKPIATQRLAPAVSGHLDPDGAHGACAREGPHGFWTLQRPDGTRPVSVAERKQFAAAITQDKDTSPPYMPFHRNRQVALFVFDAGKTASKTSCNTDFSGRSSLPASAASTRAEPWVFGLPLPPTIRITCLQTGLRELDLDVANLGLDDIPGEMEGDFADDRSDTIVQGSFAQEGGVHGDALLDFEHQ